LLVFKKLQKNKKNQNLQKKERTRHHREGKRKGSPPVFRPFSRRRVKPRAATGGRAWKDAPPLFLRWQKGFPAISGVLGTVL